MSTTQKLFFRFTLWRKQISSLQFVRQQNYCVHSSNAIEQKIEIPTRIERDPTDILRALTATVQTDPTAAHYKYHDDPYLIPKSNMGKRTFAMAQEAGRKAAVWIRQQHSDLFTQTLSEPVIGSFLPQTVYTEHSEASEDILNNVINNVQVSDAVTIYKLLESKGVEISRDTKQSLLELLCFYNEEDNVNEEFLEERWFRQGNRGRERQRKTWRDNSLAEVLFRSMDPPDARSYSTLIQGMAKYCEVDRAWKLYDETRQKNIPITVGAYNSLIQVANFLREANDMRWKLVQDLLSAMKQQQLKPNLYTLNAVLDSISTLVGSRHSKTYICQTLVEFKLLGVEPSLASWYYILITLCKDRGPISGVLYDIMNVVENQKFHIRDSKDTMFFVTAMDICRNHLQDNLLARRLDKLLHTGNNYNLIGDSYKESVYYRHYFALICKTDPLDVFMAFYDKLVPNIYTPEPGVMADVLRSIEINGAIGLLPRIWSDMIMFDHTDRENLLNLVLSIIVNDKHPETQDDYEQFVKIAWDIWTRIEEQSEGRTNRISFTGQLLSDILTVCLRGNEFAKACEVVKKMATDQNKIAGVPEFVPLELFVHQCVENKEPSKAISTVQYCVDVGFTEAGNLGRYIFQNMTLDEAYVNKLINIVGKDVLQIDLTEKETATQNI